MQPASIAVSCVALTVTVFIFVSAISPQQGSAVIREQHQQELTTHQVQHTPEPAASRRNELGILQDPMSCPSKPVDDGQPKSEWPELQGKTVEEAKAVLQQEAPGFRVQVIGPGMMATMDWRCDRIRLWLNEEQRVSQPPRVG